jgi:hypothetical protein
MLSWLVVVLAEKIAKKAATLGLVVIMGATGCQNTFLAERCSFYFLEILLAKRRIVEGASSKNVRMCVCWGGGGSLRKIVQHIHRID